jgi:iron complex outermembrane receptor protein
MQKLLLLFLLRRSLLLVACIFLFFNAFAQTITISGVVSDGTSKKPLMGVTVAAPEDGAGANTDPDGRYTFSVSKNGRSLLPLVIRYSGYNDLELEVPLGNSETIEQNIDIIPEDYTTDDVVITASKGFEQREADVTVSIITVKQKSIDLQATTNISKVITQVPGVDDLDGQINIRGSSGYAYGVGSRVMVMMDGLPLLTGDAGYPELSLIPVDNISQVEVLKGASSVLYGSGSLGGVINVLMADPGEKPRSSLRLKSTIFDRPQNRDLDWDGSGIAYIASAHFFHSRRIGDFDLTFQGDLIKDSGYRQGTDSEELRGILLTKWRPKKIPGLNVGVNVSARVDSSGNMLYWRGYFPDTNRVVNSAGDTLNVVTGGALTPSLDPGAYRKQINKRLAVDPFIKYLTKNGDLFWYRGRFLRNTNQNNSGQSAFNYILYNDFLYQKSLLQGKASWVSGITFNLGNADGDSLYSGGYLIETEDDVACFDGKYQIGDVVDLSGVHKGSWTGLYTQFDGKFGKLNTSAGIRMETVQIDNGKREWQPVIRLGLNYEIVRGTNVRASFGQAFRSPSIAERFANTAGGGVLVRPNPCIKSERGYSMEVALRQGLDFGGTDSRLRGYIDLAGFIQRYNNMVEFGLSNVQFTPAVAAEFSTINVADARIAGMELTTMLDARLGPGWSLNVSGGVTLLDARDLNAIVDSFQLDLSDWPSFTGIGQLADPRYQDRPETLKYRNKWMARFSTGIGFKNFSLTANMRYRSFVESVDQYLYVVVTDLGYFREKHPNGEFVMDGILAYNITPSSAISITVDNLTNTEYMIIPGLLAEQRNFTLQYLIRF